MKKLFMYVMIVLLTTGCVNKPKIEYYDHLVFEYGEKSDNDRFLNKDASDNQVKVKSVQGLDTHKVGSQKVKVLFVADHNWEQEVEVTVTIKDIVAPVIKLKKDIVEVNQGDDIDLNDNIRSVDDPIDGNIVYSNKQILKNGYYIEGSKLDSDKQGSYPISVYAFDKNGNRSTTVFTVKVNKKKEVAKKPITEEQVDVNDEEPVQQTPKSSSDNNNTTPSIATKPTPKPTPEQPKKCMIPDNQYGNSGKLFASWEEANNWAWDIIHSENEWTIKKGFSGYSVGGVFNTCNQLQGWSVGFY